MAELTQLFRRNAANPLAENDTVQGVHLHFEGAERFILEGYVGLKVEREKRTRRLSKNQLELLTEGKKGV